MKSLVRDYYTVSLPGDVFDSLEDLSSLAINEAKEKVRLYCVPAIWTVKVLAGEVGDHEVSFRVCRVRNKRSGD